MVERGGGKRGRQRRRVHGEEEEEEFVSCGETPKKNRTLETKVRLLTTTKKNLDKNRRDDAQDVCVLSKRENAT